jgi:hypothetical protein
MAESRRTRRGELEIDDAARTRRDARDPAQLRAELLAMTRSGGQQVRVAAPRRMRAAALAVAIVAVVLAGCGGSSSSKWENLRSVSITVSRPGLPPPGGAPQTTAFTSASAVGQATAALNAHHIAQSSSSSSNNACAGGEQIDITIVKQQGSSVHLSAYQCGGQTTGDVSGDLSGFLSALGVLSTA